MLEYWLLKQTWQPDRWLVVNDGKEKYQYTCGQQVLTRKAKKNEAHSLCANILAALQVLAEYDYTVVCEDDDWYSPDYIATMMDLLDKAEIAGLNEDCYYNVSVRKWRRLHNVSHCSLAATGWRKELLPVVGMCCQSLDPFVDLRLWDRCQGSRAIIANWPKPLHVGIKGMPVGEPGASGLGHSPTVEAYTDPQWRKLHEWIGRDAELYYDFYSERMAIETGSRMTASF